MRLAIVGGRDFNDYEKLLNIVAEHFEKWFELGVLEIISGGANGVDALAKKLAKHQGLGYVEYPADWNKYGRRAGYLRNQTIVDNCDMVLAFWDGQSRGTADTIEKAKRAMKPTFIVYY